MFALAVSAALVQGVDSGTTFATSGIDLKIDSEATYNGVARPSGTWALKNLVPAVDKFFNFDDIKPGDYGENTISMHVKKSDAWLCVDFKNLQSADNGQNEPEALADGNGNADGELAAGMEFFSWVDDGDNIFEIGERPLFGTTTQSAIQVLNNKTYSIGDINHGSSCRVNQDRYIGVYWCAGDLNVNLETAAITCDGSALGNAAQTDSMSVDVSIRAVPSGSNPSFNCKTGNDSGCSLGYWKNHTSNWKGYTKNTLFSAIFENAFPGKTLLQVLNLGGGGLNALGRQTVAALLNAAHTNVDYPYTTSQVISMFNAVYPAGSYETLKNDFEEKNTAYCPLSKDDNHHEKDYDRNQYGHNDKDYKDKDEDKGGYWGNINVPKKKGFSSFGNFFSFGRR